MTRQQTLFAALTLLIIGSACDQIELQPITDPPPSRAATIDNTNDNYHIYLSKGVALAVKCWDNCDSNCKSAGITASSDIIQAHRIYKLSDDSNSYASSQSNQNQNASNFVLVAKDTGNASVTVRSACGKQSYDVTITE